MQLIIVAIRNCRLPAAQTLFKEEHRELIQANTEYICQWIRHDLSLSISSQDDMLKEENREASNKETAAEMDEYRECADMFIWLTKNKLLLNKDGSLMTLMHIVVQYLAIKSEKHRTLGLYILGNYRQEVAFDHLNDALKEIEKDCQDRVFNMVIKYFIKTD